MYNFGTKAETLDFLYKTDFDFGAKVLPLLYFTAKEFGQKPDTVWKKVNNEIKGDKLIVRSSAKNEDKDGESQAGKFESEICDSNKEAFFKAVKNVLSSYDDENEDNQFLVQPLLENAEAAGVIFTTEPNSGANYYAVNYDSEGTTSGITSGNAKNDKLFYCYKEDRENIKDEMLKKAVNSAAKLETLFESERLDIEFAYKSGEIYILQVRPLFVNGETDRELTKKCVELVKNKVKEGERSHIFLYGKKTLHSNMTDWNPAEMIGVKPKNLALSLYKELITDETWAYQRDNYGYMRLRSFPLLINFCSMPYIDVRVSFNSFIPRDMPPKIAEKLVNYYLARLEENPENHDKVEFDIIFSCYTFDLPKRIKVLSEYGFSDEEINIILEKLKSLTNRIINSKTGLWRQDSDKIKILEKRFYEIMESDLSEVGKMYWLIEDCKRYGTLPFAGLARAGFIAVQLLKSMLAEKIINSAEYEAFMADIDTVGSKLKRDLNNISRRSFFKKYGHLRPGTYDITSKRYDEAPEIYFPEEGVKQKKKPEDTGGNFRLTLPQLNAIRVELEKHNLSDDVLGLFSFIKAAIEGRESAKFIFTKSLSEVLRLFGVWGAYYGFNAEDLAYADIGIIKTAYGASTDESELLSHSIARGKKEYKKGQTLLLPPLIATESDVTQFFAPDAKPTYITRKKVCAEVVKVKTNEEDITGKIVLISAADPGFDWIFSHNIAGFITEYGGANSHMAIRAGELQIPAAIGVGQKLFAKMQDAKTAEIDAALQRLTVVR